MTAVECARKLSDPGRQRVSPRLFDHAILGGGCAGLSLATHFADAGIPQSMVVLEARARYENDRTFCFWELEDHPFTEVCTRRWARGSILGPDGRVDVDWSDSPYAHLPADRFYRRAREVIDASANVELVTGMRVLRVQRERSRFAIETDGGIVYARRVFDARPPTPPKGSLLQHFAGLRIRCPDPCFDPDRVTLMDFDASLTGVTAFVYVLPFSTREALVESTLFSHAPQSAAWHEQRVRAWLRQRGVFEFAVAGREYGVLPMSTATGRPRSDGIDRIGTAGGAMRASSGYSFATTQRFCASLTRRLARDRTARMPRCRPRLLEFLDAVFLDFLTRNPEQSPRIFSNLFARVPTARLLRFLSDRPGLRDVLAVVAAMPTRPLLSRVPAATRHLLLQRG